MTRNDTLDILTSIYGRGRIAMCMDCNVLLPYDADIGAECPSCICDMDVFEDAAHLLDYLEDLGCEITHVVTGDDIERMVIVNVERFAPAYTPRQLLAACGW